MSRKSNRAEKPSNRTSSRTSSVSAREWRTRMQLLGFMRGKDAFMQLMNEMQQLNQELESVYQALRQCPSGTEEETQAIQQIQTLETSRFQLLGQIHGNRVNDYHLLMSQFRS